MKHPQKSRLASHLRAAMTCVIIQLVHCYLSDESSTRQVWVNHNVFPGVFVIALCITLSIQHLLPHIQVLPS